MHRAQQLQAAELEEAWGGRSRRRPEEAPREGGKDERRSGGEGLKTERRDENLGGKMRWAAVCLNVGGAEEEQWAEGEQPLGHKPILQDLPPPPPPGFSHLSLTFSPGARVPRDDHKHAVVPSNEQTQEVAFTS